MKKLFLFVLSVACLSVSTVAQSDSYKYTQRIAVFDPAGLSDTATMTFRITAFDPDGDTLFFEPVSDLIFGGLYCDTVVIQQIDSTYIQDSVQMWVPFNYWEYDTINMILIPHCEYDTIHP